MRQIIAVVLAVALMGCNNWDNDKDGYTENQGDCYDAVKPAGLGVTVYPGAPELCDGYDNDCDSSTPDICEDGEDPDNDPSTCDEFVWIDGDSDGYGDADKPRCAGVPVNGTTADNADDCDDTKVAIHPGAHEKCDGVDNDCDGILDNDDADDALTWYRDGDQDGYGKATTIALACSVPVGYTADKTDCNDQNSEVNPGATDECDSVDNDCDGQIDNDQAEMSTWYKDADNDGFGNGSGATGTQALSCHQPSGYVTDATDCDDASALKFPGNTEVCDGLDNDCDGTVDDNATDAKTWYFDGDGDGYGYTGRTFQSCSAPADYVVLDTDCDDTRGDIHPGAVEKCDGTDTDCDGIVDEEDSSDATTWYADIDQDGYGNVASSKKSCSQPSGYVADKTDCADLIATVHPGAVETCNGLDNDCDGVVDDNATDASVYYKDVDGDSFGNAASAKTACTQPTGYVTDATDCDDASALKFPGNTEVCDGLDNDCDGQVDDNATDAMTWYFDGDRDGYGLVSDSVNACSAPAKYVADDTDCDDGRVSVHPGATELCNSRDDDCDGFVDEDPSDGSVFYEDQDGDSFGNAAVSVKSCSQPSGYVADKTDCNDVNAIVYPGASELCDRFDNDCDTKVDDADPDVENQQIRWKDTDQDGYGGVQVKICFPAESTLVLVANGDDCDDTKATVNPVALEMCDSIDNNCDVLIDEDSAIDASTWYHDADGDGFGKLSNSVKACSAPTSYVVKSTDCDDTKATVNPSASELCNSLDDNCDGVVDNNATDAKTWYADADGDSFGNVASTKMACTQPSGFLANSTDCDDANRFTYPGASELCDGQDNDCDSAVDEGLSRLWYPDADSDGYGGAIGSISSCAPGVGYSMLSNDCDDTRSQVNPGMTEVCDNGLNDDCDTTTTDACSTNPPNPTGFVGGLSIACADSGSYVMMWIEALEGADPIQDMTLPVLVDANQISVISWDVTTSERVKTESWQASGGVMFGVPYSAKYSLEIEASDGTRSYVDLATYAELTGSTCDLWYDASYGTVLGYTPFLP